MDSTIIMGADNNSTTYRETTATIIGQGDLLPLNVTMALSALVATMAEVVVKEIALVLFVALPGTKRSSALRHAKHQCLSLRRLVVLKSHVMFMNGHHHMMFKLQSSRSSSFRP